ncbi:GIP [Symbiodinium natans]|uniref:GIP protein n=1 Tax=Symbiodinium natans TaxID=878477 RepID=A0A812P6P6_9DINO|nr:GIP [Symbiodinium natans]
MAQSPNSVGSSSLDLGTRLARLQDPTSTYTVEQLESLDMQTLVQFQVDFGKKMVGKTFAEALESSPEWGKWCCDHLQDSAKVKHRALLIYIRKYVEQAEAIEAVLQSSPSDTDPHDPRTRGSSAKAAPKSKPKVAAKPSQASAEDPWDVISAIEPDGSVVEDQVNALAGRMNHMEQIMEQVLGAIQQLHVTQHWDKQEVEDHARSLVQRQATATELKRFLRSVPWHLLDASPASLTASSPTDTLKEPAYLTFGSFRHGGVQGITRVSKEFPWVTQALTRVLRLTDPQHPFTTVAISCNTSAPPHRDVHNLSGTSNLVVPLNYPSNGGEVWSADKAHPHQREHVVECNRQPLVGFSLKTAERASVSDAEWLRQHGFPESADAPANCVDERPNSELPSPLRCELTTASSLLTSSDVTSIAQDAAVACANAYARAEDAAWAVYQDSQLSYGVPKGKQLDLLEVYAYDNSQLTSWVNRLGGKARRFTRTDGDLSSPEGQRRLWDIIQQEQPRHIWMAPECRLWCSWTNLHSARSIPSTQHHLPAQKRAADPSSLAHERGLIQQRLPEIQVQVLQAWAPPPIPIHGPAFRNLSKEEKSTLIRVHANLGHPAPQTLSNHLRAAGADPSLVQAALEYQCDSCLESVEPRLQRPSKLSEPREFNDVIGVDGFFFKSKSGYKSYVLHALDEASCFHMGRRTQSRQTAHALESLTNFWFTWAGNPRKIYLDPAGEFRSSEILDHFQSLSIQTFVTAAAWQRGRLERHGDVLKDILQRLDTQMPLINDVLFDQALVQALQAKNALMRFKGYAPEQIVLGKSLRIPGSVTSDEDLSAHAIVEGSDLEAEMQRQRLELRCMARKAFWEADNSQTIRRAMLRRSHPMRGGANAFRDLMDSAVPEAAAPSVPSALPSSEAVDPMSVPVPESDDGLVSENIFLACENIGISEADGNELVAFTHVETSEEAQGPPLAEDGFPYITQPLECGEQQAYCLEIPMNAKNYRKCLREDAREQMTLLASVSKRSRSEVYLKDLNAQERQLFAQAKDKEIQCWLQTSAIKAVLRLVVLGYQDPKLVEVMRDAPTLSREGRFTRHPLEPCVFMLYTGHQLNGILGMHVDDGVGGGDTKFNAKLQELEKKLPFGSRKYRDFVFTGIHLQQLPDFSIRASQSSYVRNIPQIDIGRPRRMTPEAQINESERSKLRGLVGSLQYAVTHTRPDIAAKLGEVQSQITQATVQTLLLANKVLREAQEHHAVCIYFLPITPSELTFVSFGDASFASSKNLNSHQAALVCATDSSTLSAEAYAMSKAVDLLGWLRAMWGVIHVPDFSWQKPTEGFKKLPTAVVVTDCKSLYDLVTRLAMPSCEEYRTTLEVLLIKQRCEENTCFRWIPTTLQAADSLTKAMDASLLRAVLSQSRFKLYDSDNTLDKAAQRQQAVQWISQNPHQLAQI